MMAEVSRSVWQTKPIWTWSSLQHHSPAPHVAFDTTLLTAALDKIGGFVELWLMCVCVHMWVCVCVWKFLMCGFLPHAASLPHYLAVNPPHTHTHTCACSATHVFHLDFNFPPFPFVCLNSRQEGCKILICLHDRQPGAWLFNAPS